MTSIRHVLRLKAQPSAIREALTTDAGLKSWWAKDSDIGADAHTLRFVKGGHRVVMKFTVDVNTSEEVRWTCTDNGNPVWIGTTLSWRFSAADDGAELVFEHAGFKESESEPYKMTVGGWEHFVESLKQYLESGIGMPS